MVAKLRICQYFVICKHELCVYASPQWTVVQYLWCYGPEQEHRQSVCYEVPRAINPDYARYLADDAEFIELMDVDENEVS